MTTPNFVDKTIWTGDNLHVLRGLNSESVDLIYLDPPFNSNRDYEAPIGSNAAGAAFKDTWTLSDLDVAWVGLIADQRPDIALLLNAAGQANGRGMQSYLTMMAVRLMEMARLLKPTGSIYLHCDPYASHYLKMLMDAVFGKRNFLNEVIWYYRGAGVPKKLLARRHDVLLWYAKRFGQQVFNPDPIRQPYAQATVERFRHYIGNVRGQRDYGQQELNPIGKHPDDVISNIQPIAPSAKERTGYPTQKPLALLERIIGSSSNPGDVVLDPFCGCATACVAAEKLERQWIGIDISPKAVELVQDRLQSPPPLGIGSLFHYGYVTVRTDIPRRTDIDTPINYRQNKHELFGRQEGRCNGCHAEFAFRHLEVDHIIAQSLGGTDHLENLQLLCGSCNRIKGNRTQEYLIAQLKSRGLIST